MVLSKKVLIKKSGEYDPIWHVQLVVLLAIVLQVSLPDRFSAGLRFG